MCMGGVEGDRPPQLMTSASPSGRSSRERRLTVALNNERHQSITSMTGESTDVAVLVSATSKY